MIDVTPRRRRHRRRSPVVTGIVLMVVGALLLMINLGYGLPPSFWAYWPLALIFLGVMAIIFPVREGSRAGGIWLLATGLYCEASVQGIFGLDWHSAWPIFLVAAGLSVIVDRGRRCRFHDDNASPRDPGQWGHGAS